MNTRLVANPRRIRARRWRPSTAGLSTIVKNAATTSRVTTWVSARYVR